MASTFHEGVAFTVALQGPLWVSNLLKKITCLLTYDITTRYPYYTKNQVSAPKRRESATSQGGLCSLRLLWVGKGH